MSEPAPLHVTSYGEHGPRVLFCHGLFGQGRNWTRIGKALAGQYRVELVDLPDHGTSPRSDHFDYLEIADRVAALATPDDPVALVGHSMGGKVAMLAALRHPDLVERLVVVDVSPVRYDHSTEFAGYLNAMRGIDLATLTERSQADAALADAVPDPMVRGFLLQSLRRGDPEGPDGSGPQGWHWLLNLDLLARELDAITEWPTEALRGVPPYGRPVLWIGGGESTYVEPAYVAAMEELFPHVRRVTIKGAGHWVHSQQPEVFTEVLRRFLARSDQPSD